MVNQINPYTVSCERALIIPDVHQDINWVKNILNQESGNYDHLVFLGDFFDTHKSGHNIASGEQTALFLKDIVDGKFGSSTVCVGNHDCAYIEACRSLYQHKNPSTLFNFCSGYTNSKANTISGILKRTDWAKAELFKVVNGWLLSHAGLHAGHLKPLKSIDENLVDLYEQSINLNKCLYHDVHPLLQVGYARGGEHNYGGVTWIDWNCEFEDIPGFPQLVGHTPKTDTIRQIGKSFCIDGGQTIYAFINKDGSIEWKNYRFEEQYDAILKPFLTTIGIPIIVRNDDEHVKGRQTTTNQNLYH